MKRPTRVRSHVLKIRAVLLAAIASAVLAPVVPYAHGGESVLVKSREELIRAVESAKPGAEIAIASGTYEGGLVFSGLRGAEDRPIVIRAADERTPPVFRGGNSGWHLSDPEFVELRHLIFEGGRGNGLNIDDGGSYETPARGVVLWNVTVRDAGSEGNHDGIKLSGVDDFRLENCMVERWGKRGSAMDLVGCHRGSISHCTFHEGAAEANGVQLKGGSSDVVVSHCRFENAGGRAVNLGGSTGTAYFRPMKAPYEAKDIVVEDCTFVGSMAPVAFVGIDGAIVRHNVFFRPRRWVLRILQENQAEGFVPSRGGKFTNNIVAFQTDELATAVNVGPKTAPETFEFAENFWYAIDDAESTRRAVKLPTAERDAVYGQDPGFVDAAQGDFSLKEDSPARDFGPRPETPRKE